MWKNVHLNGFVTIFYSDSYVIGRFRETHFNRSEKRFTVFKKISDLSEYCIRRIHTERCAE